MFWPKNQLETLGKRPMTNTTKNGVVASFHHAQDAVSHLIDDQSAVSNVTILDMT